MLEAAIALFVKFATIGGGMWGVWGAIQLGTGLHDKNGPAMQSGLWQLIGGGLIVAAAQLFKTIAL